MFEFEISPEEIFFDLSEICLLQREYRSRVGFKYLTIEEFEQKLKSYKKEQSSSMSVDKIQHDD